jgi:hypothetical protein
MSEAAIRAYLAAADRLAAEHPDWLALVIWAARQRALYDASRRQWRGQSPAIDVSAVEGAYDLTPAVLTIRAQLGVGEGSGPAQTW